MFTGIIEEIGKISSITKNRIQINAKTVLEDIKLGDSIAVNGVCLTVTNIDANGFTADVSDETLSVSALGRLKSGDFVNLERAMKLNDRFGGHIVSGHVDGVGKIINLRQNGDFYDLQIELNENQSKYVIKKGSITINGISLTIADVNNDKIMIAVIPHTFENTTLKTLKIGDYVNIEVDMISKYVEKFLSTRDNKSGISMEFLRENGF